MLDMSHESLKFRKSSYSSGRQENCVEVAEASGSAAVRDTQNRNHGHLMFPSEEWLALITASR